MKRPELEVLFASVPLSTTDLAAKWLRMLLDERDGSLGSYYARAPIDSSSGEHEPVDEALDLTGRSDLLHRGNRDGEFAFTVRVPFGFANADTILTLFRDEAGRACSLVRIDPSITRFVETEGTTRAPLVASLITWAVRIGSQEFLGGLRLPWRPLTGALISAGGGEESWPYVAGWPADDASQARTEKWPAPPPALALSVQGFVVATRWPR